MYRLIWIPIAVVVVLAAILVLSRKPSFITQKSIVQVSVTPVLDSQVIRTTITPIAANSEAIETTISGTIDEVAADTLKLQTIVDPVSNKSRSYTVTFSSSTKIFRKPITIPYLLKQNTDESTVSAPKNDLKKGMYIDVVTKSDVSKTNIKAISLSLPRIPYIIEGLVQSKNGNVLTVDAVPVLEAIPQNGKPPEHVTYTVAITQNTEISRQLEPSSDGTGGQIKEFTVADISLQERIVIYSTADVTKSHSLTAARIEPVL